MYFLEADAQLQKNRDCSKHLHFLNLFRAKNIIINFFPSASESAYLGINGGKRKNQTQKRARMLTLK